MRFYGHFSASYGTVFRKKKRIWPGKDIRGDLEMEEMKNRHLAFFILHEYIKEKSPVTI